MYHNSKTRRINCWRKWRESGAIPKPQFFLYYGRHSMCLDTEVLKKLSEEELLGLSKPELEFYKHWKETGLLDIHSGSCVGKQPKQRELCKMLMKIFATCHQKEDIPVSELV